MPVPRVLVPPVGAVVANLEHEGAVRLHPRAPARSRARACLCALRRASASTDWASGSSSCGHLGALVPVELERKVVVMASQPGQLLAQGRAGVHARRRKRARERVAQVAQRRVHLIAAAPAGLVVQRGLGAEHERHAEQALHHALVDVPRQVDARLEQPRARLLARGDPGAGRQRGGLAERPHRVALLLGELEAGAAAVGEDHAQPAPAGRDRRAGERLDTAQQARSGAAPSAPARRSPRPRGPRPGPPGRWASPRACRRPRRTDRAPPRGCPPAPPVGAHRRRAAGRPAQRREAADRGAEAVVDAPVGRSGRRRGVQLRQQLDDHVEGVGAQRQALALSHQVALHATRRGRQEFWSDNRSVCSEVSDTTRA